MFRPTPPNDWQTLPGFVWPNWKRQQEFSEIIIVIYNTIEWNLQYYKLTRSVLVFPLAIKSTFIPPMTTCNRGASYVLYCGNIWLNPLQNWRDSLCVFILTISESDFFPWWSGVLLNFLLFVCFDSAQAIWLPTLALLRIRAMSRNKQVKDSVVIMYRRSKGHQQGTKEATVL